LQQTKARTAKQAAVRALRCIAREIMVRTCSWRQKYATIKTPPKGGELVLIA
jgi:hypothetical protein